MDTQLLITLVLIIIRSSSGFASWFATDYCTRKLAVGQVIMNSKAVRSGDRHIIVYRGITKIQSNETFVAGETLEVTLSDVNDQYVFDVQNAVFQDGGCSGHRINDKEMAKLLISVDASESIIITAGWALGHSVVYIAEDFILRSPSSLKSPGNVNNGVRDTTKVVTQDQKSAAVTSTTHNDKVESMGKTEEPDDDDRDKDVDDTKSVGDFMEPQKLLSAQGASHLLHKSEQHLRNSAQKIDTYLRGASQSGQPLIVIGVSAIFTLSVILFLVVTFCCSRHSVGKLE